MEFLKKYRTLILYSVIFVACLTLFILFGYSDKSTVWDIVTAIDSATAIALAVLAGIGYWEFIRSEDRVKVVVSVNGEEFDTGFRLLRKDVKRGEIGGLLGLMLRDQKSRYNVKSLNDPKVHEHIYEVNTGTSDKVVIPMSSEEAQQFDIPDMVEKESQNG